MPNFTSIKNYHREMAKLGDFLDELFRKNRSNIPVRKEYAIEMTGEENEVIDRLILKNVIYEDQGQLFLYDNHRIFYESVLEVPRELNNYLIREYIEKLTEAVKSWSRSNSEREKSKIIENVRRTLMDIVNNVKQNIDNLNALLTEKYDAEPDFQERIRLLKKYDEKREDVVQLIDNVFDIINNEKRFFSNNELLFGTVMNVRQLLTGYRKELTSYHNRILDHLNKIERQQAFVKKIRWLKNLKENMALETETNIVGAMNHVDGLLFKKADDMTRISTNVSITFLRDDDRALDALEIIRAEVSKRYSGNSTKTTEEKNVRLNDKQNKTIPDIRKPIDLPTLENEFLHQDNDLFSFVMNYSFKDDKDNDFRIMLYVKLADRIIQKAAKNNIVRKLNLKEIKYFQNFKYINILPL